MPEVTTHPPAQALALFGHGKLPQEQTAAVAAHLATCADCRRAVAALPPDTFLGKVRAAGPGDASPPPDASPVRADPPPPAGLPPELAGHPKFRILRELGKGGMGVVYQAEQTLMKRPIAIKVINPSVLDHPDSLARFRAEVEAAGRLDHPNIVRAYDADQAGELHLLVMEFVEGISLAQLLMKKGPLPVAHACHYVRQAALGLQHAFERGMAHRDVKPQNLMLTPKGAVKVLDFGLARLRGEQRPGPRLTQLESFMGTPEYVAPEQATDARKADTRSDVYSLGCTLYALLAGRPPFVEDTAVKVVLAHIEKEPRPLPELRPDVPAGLWDVLTKMLAKDPARRFQRPIDVAQALAPFARPAGKVPVAAGAAPPPGAATGTRTSLGGSTSRLKGLAQGVAKRPADATAGQDSPFRDLDEPSSPSEKPEGREAAEPAWAAWLMRWRLLAGAAVAVMVLAGAVIAIRARSPGKGGPQAVAQGTEPKVAGSPRPEPPQSETEQARAELARARDEARQKLLANFDAVLKRLAKAAEPGEESPLAAAVKAERERFDQRGLVPWSEPMRPYMLAYLYTMRAERESAGQVYAAEIAEQVRQNNEAKADQLRAELREAVAVGVVARWNHEWPGGTGIITLFANGKLSNPDGDNTWTFEDGVLRLRWPNADAREGYWLDSCPVAADGRSYAGQNQLGALISGTYREEE